VAATRRCLRRSAAGVALLAVAALAAGAASPAAAVPSSTTAGPPNVVMFVLDDIPQLDGRWWAYLPTIRSTFYAAGATQFLMNDAETELCCPARAGLLTGQHTWNHGVTINDGSLFHAQGSVQTTLHDAGYTTILAGKYFNLMAKTMRAGKPQGWDSFDGIEGAYYDYDLYHFTGSGPVTRQHYGERPADYSSDVISTRAVAALRAAPPSKPLFAYVAPYGPHNNHGEQTATGEVTAVPAPRYAASRACDTIGAWGPPSYNRAMANAPAWVQRAPALTFPGGYPLTRQCLSLLAVDDLVRNVLDELRREGRLDNSLLIFSGDNGMNYGAHKLVGKILPYGTRVPLSIVVPTSRRTAATPAAVRERSMNIDVPVTIAEVTGTHLGPYANGQTAPDGVSLLPLLTGKAGDLGRDAVIEDYETRNGWRALRTTAVSPLARQGCTSATSGGCRWHYIESLKPGGFRELYDRSGGDCWTWHPGSPGDPCELVNVAANPAYAPIVTALHQRLVQIRGQ
jgi:arylsulfatase A-like enzyme